MVTDRMQVKASGPAACEPPFQEWKPGMPAEQVSTAVFDGALLLFRDIEPLQRLVQRVRLLVEETFGSADPERVAAQMARR